MVLWEMSIVILMGRSVCESFRKHLMQTNLQLKRGHSGNESLIDGAIREESFKLEQDLGHNSLRCHTLYMGMASQDFNVGNRIPAMFWTHSWLDKSLILLIWLSL